MLCILHEIGLHRSAASGEIDTAAFKIVYVAPMKALVAEMVGGTPRALGPAGRARCVLCCGPAAGGCGADVAWLVAGVAAGWLWVEGVPCAQPSPAQLPRWAACAPLTAPPAAPQPPGGQLPAAPQALQHPRRGAHR
jgi:hypothetical protein